MWSPPDDVEVGGTAQAEGGADLMWSTDQRGVRMPWIGGSVSSPVGAPSLLEIQEQEFKHAEQMVRREEVGEGMHSHALGVLIHAYIQCIYAYIHTVLAYMYVCNLRKLILECTYVLHFSQAGDQ